MRRYSFFRAAPAVQLLLLLSLCISLQLFSLTVTGKNLASDTTFTLSLRVKMSQAVKNGIFLPDSSLLYAVFEEPLPTVQMVRNQGDIYTGSVTEGIDSGSTYRFRMRINDTLYESFSRSVQISEVNTLVEIWWNDEPASTVTFLVDMQYMAALGLFNPDSSEAELFGNINDYQGSGPMKRIDTTLVYRVRYSPDPATMCIYYYQINGDTTITEQANRYLRIPDTNCTVTGYFDNINPGKIPVTFHCDMEYQILAGHYSDGADYTDLVGNFNGWEGNDVMTDENQDSIFSLTILVDTALAHQGPLEFKYRISGDWDRAELPGLPARTYNLPDTGGTFSAWFDDKNPDILTPPWAYDAGIQGLFINDQIITGRYTYENCNFIPEGISLYQWYRSNDSLMIDMVPIDTANRITYSTDTLDVGKWLVFEVTPVAASGDSATGKPVRVITGCRIGAVGIPEYDISFARVFPNPCLSLLYFNSRYPLYQIEVLDLTGRTVTRTMLEGNTEGSVDCASFSPGIYLLKGTSAEGRMAFAKFLKH